MVILTWLVHRSVATTHLAKHNRPRKSFTTHWPGVKNTFHVTTTTTKISINFWKKNSLSGYLRLLQITEYLQLKATDSTKL